MGYSAQAVANCFLDLAQKEGKEITPLKIQKLVYLAHGWHLALTEGDPLVDDELVEAWQYGPVFPSLYFELIDFGKNPITRKAQEYRFDESTEEWLSWNPYIRPSDSYTNGFIEHIWKLYKGYSAVQLSTKTHETDSPWSQISKETNIKNAHIPNDIIKEYYEKRLKKT